MERYIGTTYSNIWQPEIMTKTPENFPNPQIPTIIPDTGAERPKTGREMTYTRKKNIDEAIRQKLSNKDVYETYMHNIYNIIVGQKNEKLQEKAARDASFQGFKSG